LYSSPNIITIIKSKRMRWAGYIAYVRQKRNAYRFLMRKTQGKTPLGRARRVREDNIKVYLRDMGWRVWIGLDWPRVQDQWRAHVNTILNLRVA
jgi:hypothetical protein